MLPGKATRDKPRQLLITLSLGLLGFVLNNGRPLESARANSCPQSLANLPQDNFEPSLHHKTDTVESKEILWVELPTEFRRSVLTYVPDEAAASIQIEGMLTQRDFRNRGYSTLLLNEMLRRHPNTRTISATLTGTNYDAFAWHISDRFQIPFGVRLVGRLKSDQYEESLRRTPLIRALANTRTIKFTKAVHNPATPSLQVTLEIN